MSNILDIKSNWDSKVPVFRDKTRKLFGEQTENESGNKLITEKANNLLNPLVNKQGNLVNPYVNYQAVLDNPNTSSAAKSYIRQATGLTETPVQSAPAPTVNSGGNSAPGVTVKSQVTPIQQTKTPAISLGTGEFTDRVGKRIADTSKYNNSAAKGQCVWYVRGRVEEKLGIKLGAMGNGNQMYHNAKSDAKLAPTVENIKPNILVSYNKGTSSAGQKYGHVIFVEDVVGDTVYYTEGGSGYYKNGTDGVVKTTTKANLLKGVNDNGGRIGNEVLGFVDVSKYK